MTRSDTSTTSVRGSELECPDERRDVVHGRVGTGDLQQRVFVVPEEALRVSGLAGLDAPRRVEVEGLVVLRPGGGGRPILIFGAVVAAFDAVEEILLLGGRVALWARLAAAPRPDAGRVHGGVRSVPAEIEDVHDCLAEAPDDVVATCAFFVGEVGS